MISRRDFIRSGVAVSGGLGCGLGAGLAHAQAEWPDKPVKIILGFPPGGASDVVTRMVADQLSTRFHQQFIVDNRTGAAGNIAMEAVATAPPDGYTLSAATVGTLSINQFLFAKIGYDPVKDFAYVSTYWENTNVLVVPVDNPSKTVAEFVAWARAKPEGVTFSSSGSGTTPHLSAEMFGQRMGLKTTHVPFRGGPQAATELASGRIDFAIDNVANQTALLKAGKVRALAVTSADRWPQFPDVPTMAEAGVPNFVITSWGAMVAPAGTSPAIVNKLSAALQDIAKMPLMKERFLTANARITASTPAEAAAFATRERAKWREAVRVAGVKPE